MTNGKQIIIFFLPVMILIVAVISACQNTTPVSPNEWQITETGLLDTSQMNLNPSSTNTIQVVITSTVTPSPSITSSPTISPSPTSTAFNLDFFDYDFRPNEVHPQQYQDTCEYLANRWDDDKSEPGTIVVPVMYHSIRKNGRPLQDDMQVSQEYFEYTMEYAKKMGFETITTEELVGFLYNNDRIPQYSMILIIDDRRLGVVNEHFMKYLNENDWTVTLAYITGVATENEWREFQRLNVDNHLDLQAHGFFHNADTYITEFTPLEIIEEEIYAPIEVIEERSGRRPQAFIWPGGNFTEESVKIARQAGYEVGFTVYSRGPLMYNWIPLGATEVRVNDPLLVLPRFWSNTAALYLERAIEISSQAQEFADLNKSKELIWFQNYCSEYPPIKINNQSDE